MNELENQQSETPVETHLKTALDEDDPAEKDYHVRSALQYYKADRR